MATLTPLLKLTSADATADPLALSETDTLTVQAPSVSLAKASILHTAPTNILTAAANTLDTYVYLKNTDATNFVEVKTDAAAVLIQLNPGEFAFFPVQGAIGLELQASTATCVIDYGYWTKG